APPDIELGRGCFDRFRSRTGIYCARNFRSPDATFAAEFGRHHRQPAVPDFGNRDMATVACASPLDVRHRSVVDCVSCLRCDAAAPQHWLCGLNRRRWLRLVDVADVPVEPKTQFRLRDLIWRNVYFSAFAPELLMKC